MKRIFSYLSALFVAFSCGIFAYVMIKTVSRTLDKHMEKTAEEIKRLASLGELTWKSYLLSYFLVAFLAVGAVIALIAAIRNGGSAVSASGVLAVPTILFYGLIAMNVLKDNKYEYDKDLFLISLVLYLLSHFMLLIFVFITSKEKKRKCT